MAEAHPKPLPKVGDVDCIKGVGDGSLLILDFELTWNEGKIEDVLLGVVRHALWKAPLPSGELTAKRFRRLMGEATRQAVSGIVADALMESGSGVVLPKEQVLQLIVHARGVRASNAKIAASLQSLCRLFASRGVPVVVVKGQVVGALYPHPELRMPGDIDFYVAPADWDNAMRLVKDSWKPNFHKDEDGEQHVAFNHDGTLFEMHYNLYKFYDKRNQAFFDGLLAYNISHKSTARVPGVDGAVPVLCPPDNVLYTFLHLYHHLVELGCGLRQFCDVAVLLSRFEQTGENVGRLRNDLESLGFMGAFRAVGAVLVDYLGLPAAKFPFPIGEADRKHSGEILSIVFWGGNFGFYGVGEPLRSGWRYYVKAFFRKLRRYRTFYSLAPRETRAMLMREMPKKIGQALMRGGR